MGHTYSQLIWQESWSSSIFRIQDMSFEVSPFITEIREQIDVRVKLRKNCSTKFDLNTSKTRSHEGLAERITDRVTDYGNRPWGIK